MPVFNNNIPTIAEIQQRPQPQAPSSPPPPQAPPQGVSLADLFGINVSPMQDQVGANFDTIADTYKGAGVVDPVAAERSRKMAETQAAIDATNQNISAQDTALTNRLSTLEQEYQRILSQYTAEVERNQAKYDEQVGSNESTRDRNRHLGLVSAAQGGRGLRATLGSLGALDESGSRLASRAVAQAANMDIGEADRTFDTNAKQLSTAWGDFKEDDEARRSEAERAKISQRENARYESDVAKAGLYEKLGGLYSQREDSANASKYVRQAGELTADATSRRPAAVAELKPTAAKFEAGQLAKYLAGQNNMAVTAAQGAASGVPQLFANNRRRDREEAI